MAEEKKDAVKAPKATKAKTETKAPSKKAESKFLLYKGKPLVRSGNTIYYGDPRDEYVAMLDVLSTEPFDGIELSGKVRVRIMASDPTKVTPDKILWKSGEKNGLYNALNIADIWLERANSEK